MPSGQARREARERLGVTDGTPLIVAVGRLVEKKGFAYLIDAAAILAREFPALRVVIAGGGDLESALRDRAAACGVADRVLFPGMLLHDAVPALLAAADVAVAPSVRDDAGNVDGLPNTVMEIMASATPLVATAAGGIGAVAIDDVTARIVAERDPEGLAAAIRSLLRQPELSKAIGHRARETVCRDHSWERVAQTFDAIYRTVDAGAQRSPRSGGTH